MEKPRELNRYEWWWCRFLHRHAWLRNTWASEVVMLAIASIALYAFYRVPAGSENAGWIGFGAGILLGGAIGRSWPVAADKVIAGLTTAWIAREESRGESP